MVCARDHNLPIAKNKCNTYYPYFNNVITRKTKVFYFPAHNFGKLLLILQHFGNVFEKSILCCSLCHNFCPFGPVVSEISSCSAYKPLSKI